MSNARGSQKSTNFVNEIAQAIQQLVDVMQH